MVPPSNPMSFRTLSLRSVPHYVSPLSGHAILCSQGASGGGGHSHLSCVRVVTVPSLGGGLKVRIFYFLISSGGVYFCLGGPHDGVGRVGLGPPVGVFPLFKLEFSQQKKKFCAEITMSTPPKWVI